MNKINLNGIKKPDELFKKITDYFSGFKQKIVVPSKAIRDDEFYTSQHRISNLMSKDEQSTEMYLYDKRTFCRGCEVNCGRVYNQLELRSFNDDSKVSEFMGICVDTSHELTRNLAVGLSFGHEDLEIRTWHENHPENIRQGRIRIFEGSRVRDIDSGYEQTESIIKQIRSQEL